MRGLSHSTKDVIYDSLIRILEDNKEPLSIKDILVEFKRRKNAYNMLRNTYIGYSRLSVFLKQLYKMNKIHYRKKNNIGYWSMVVINIECIQDGYPK